MMYCEILWAKFDVVDLLEGVAGRARGGEDAEAGTGVAEGPAGQLDGLGLEQAAGLRGQIRQGGCGYGALLVVDDFNRWPKFLSSDKNL